MEFVLEWLPPRDLASMALTCSKMAAAVRKVSSKRASDVTQGMEKLPVAVVSSVGECGYPYFEYTTELVHGGPRKPFRWGARGSSRQVISNLALNSPDGCDCTKCEVSNTQGQILSEDELSSPARKRLKAIHHLCGCGKTVFGELAYDSEGRLYNIRQDLSLIYECGPACPCDRICVNRTSQRGPAVKLTLNRDTNKGWGLHAAQDIEKGTFICRYRGELLTNTQARRRQQAYDKEKNTSAALLVVREHLPSGQASLRMNIDATYTGNVARFLNHSCDGGNLFSCLVRTAGECLVYHVAFFAAEDILAGTELTFSYGEIQPEQRAGGVTRPCYCGASNCRGVLPSETT